jgi:superfamily II DNA or RNA helicase
VDVIVDGLAWLPKSELTGAQIYNLKKTLTVVPRRTSEEGDDPEPIPLYRDTDDRLGIPRDFFFQHKRSIHRVEMRVSEGSKLWTPAKFEGELRDEQALALREITSQFRAGRLGGIVQARPGWGKTVCALAIAADMNVPTLVVVHKEFLMNQWKERIERFLPDAVVGHVQQGICEFKGATIVMGMVHSLGGADYSAELYDWPGLVIVDECFVGTQRVLTPEGAVPISEVCEGDRVLNAVGEGVVTSSGYREVTLRDLVQASFSDGSCVLCTNNHPFLTGRGWVRAEELRWSDVVLTHRGCTGIVQRHGQGTINSADVRVLRETELREGWEKVLLSRLRGVSEATFESAVRGVWDEACEAGQESLLLASLSAEMDERETRLVGVEGEPVARDPGVAREEPRGRGGSFKADGSREPDARQGDEGEGLAQPSRNGTCSSDERGQRSADADASTTAPRSSRLWMGCGARGCDPCKEGPGWTANTLQDRHRESRSDDRDRGGRSVSQQLVSEGAGPAKDDFPRVLRVDCVSRPEPEDLERFGVGFSSPGRVRVYNLSVSGHPSYVLDSGVVVHNCHRIGARTWAPVPPRFSAKWRLGFTATPRRKDLADDVFWKHIGRLIFVGKEERLRPQVKRVWTNFKMLKTQRFNPMLAPRALLLRFLCGSKHRNKLICTKIAEAVQKGRKCLVLSERLNHLSALEEGLEQAWADAVGPYPSVGWYVGGRKPHQLAEAAKAQVIFATSQYAAEGLDIPPLDTLFLTTPLSDVEQAVGRILRPHPDKKDPIVVDFRDDAIPMFEAQAAKRDRYYSTIS